MSIAITEDHRALADTVGDFLTKREAATAARALLEAAAEENAAFYADAAALGWLGLHVPEQHGGSGYGLEELVVVVEQFGRAVAPGAFVPTVVASAVLAAAAPDDVAATLLPGLVDGSTMWRGRPRRRRRAPRRRAARFRRRGHRRRPRRRAARRRR